MVCGLSRFLLLLPPPVADDRPSRRIPPVRGRIQDRHRPRSAGDAACCLLPGALDEVREADLAHRRRFRGRLRLLRELHDLRGQRGLDPGRRVLVLLVVRPVSRLPGSSHPGGQGRSEVREVGSPGPGCHRPVAHPHHAGGHLRLAVRPPVEEGSLAHDRDLGVGVRHSRFLGPPPPGSDRVHLGHVVDAVVPVGRDLPGGDMALAPSGDTGRHLGVTPHLSRRPAPGRHHPPGRLLPPSPASPRAAARGLRWGAVEAVERAPAALLVLRGRLLCRGGCWSSGDLDVEKTPVTGLDSLVTSAGGDHHSRRLCPGGGLHRVSGVGLDPGCDRGSAAGRGLLHVGLDDADPELSHDRDRRSGGPRVVVQRHLHRRLGQMELLGLRVEGEMARVRGTDAGARRIARGTRPLGGERRPERLWNAHGADADSILDRGGPPLHGGAVLRVVAYHTVSLHHVLGDVRAPLQPDPRSHLPHR